MVKKENVSVLYTHLVAAVSSIQDLICLKFRLSMEADVLTSVFISMAMAPTPTALICMMSCFSLSVEHCNAEEFLTLLRVRTYCYYKI